MRGWTAILVFSTLLDGLVVGLVLAWCGRVSRRVGRNPYVRLSHVLAAAAAGSVLFAAKLPLHVLLGVRFFGLAHLVYGVVAVLAPAFALAIVAGAVVARWRGGPRPFSVPVVVLAGFCLLTIPVTVRATFVEPYRLVVEAVEVPILRGSPAGPPIRVGVLADLQTDRVTEYERQAVDRLLSLRPDIILLPGDFFQPAPGMFEQELPALRELLARLDAPGGVHAVQGNIDDRRNLLRMFEGTAIRLLDNEVTRVRVGGRTLAIGGVEFWFAGPAAEGAVRALGEMRDCDARILVSHTPDVVLGLRAGDGVDLVVSGHAHGGQVQIPGLGPLVTACQAPRATAAGGLTRVNGVYTYVSRGVGHERGMSPRVRLFCPPEMSLLTLIPR
jgi:hypothetical protein